MSSHHGTLLSSCHASWLLSHLSSRCPLVLSSLRRLVFSPRLSLSSPCTTLSLSHCTGWLLLHCLLLCCLSLRCCLVLSSRRSLVLLLSFHCAAILPYNCTCWGCCVASRHATVSSSRCPLTAPPSRCIIPQASCCVARCVAVSSSRRAAV